MCSSIIWMLFLLELLLFSSSGVTSKPTKNGKLRPVWGYQPILPAPAHPWPQEQVTDVPKWGDDMFGQGCKCSFHLSCHNDVTCHHHGPDYRCVYSCCGTRCVFPDK